MGKTDIFCPGVENAPVAELEASAAAAETDALEEASFSPAGVGTEPVATEDAGP